MTKKLSPFVKRARGWVRKLGLTQHVAITPEGHVVVKSDDPSGIAVTRRLAKPKPKRRKRRFMENWNPYGAFLD